MTESADILISHFRDALKQAQGYVNYGLLAGLLSLLTTAGVTGSGEGGEVRFNVPLVGPLDELSAMVVLMIAFTNFGVLANTSLSQAKTIIGKLRTESVDLDVITTYPSTLTINNEWLRCMTALLPAILMYGSLLAASAQDPNVTMWSWVGGFFFASPYLVLAYRLLKPLDY